MSSKGEATEKEREEEKNMWEAIFIAGSAALILYVIAKTVF